MAKKRKKEKTVRKVDPIQILMQDLKRMGIWVVISVGVTALLAGVIETIR